MESAEIRDDAPRMSTLPDAVAEVARNIHTKRFDAETSKWRGTCLQIADFNSDCGNVQRGGLPDYQNFISVTDIWRL